MNVVRHYAGSVKFVLLALVSVEDALENDVTFGRTQVAMITGGKCDSVFPPWALKVREMPLGVQNVSGGFGGGADTSTRGACAPRSLRFHTPGRKVAHGTRQRSNVIRRCAAATTHHVEPAVLCPLRDLGCESFCCFWKTGRREGIRQTRV